MPIAAVTLSTLFAAILWWMYRTHHHKTRTGRSHLFDDCIDLLESPKLTRNEAGYAKLKGHYRGYSVRMCLEEDHMALRKIPSLWLHLSVEGAGSEAVGTLDMLMRPQNTEFYSPSWNWDGHVLPLPGWPAHAIYRTQGETPDMQAIDAHVRQLFADDKAKELLLTPRVVRLTYQAKQAERGEYLLLRSTNFDDTPLPPDKVLALLERAVGIRQDLEGVKVS